MVQLYLLIIIASIVIGLIGINRKFGFWGYFFASLLLTPIVGILLLLASDPKKKRKKH